MITIKDKSKCCGCFACMNICPKNAIIMQEDENGFKYPKIDKDKCVNCNLCEKVCPIIKNKKNDFKQKVYAVINKNEKERLYSSSGGIFILLAKEIIKRNGIVFGAAFDKEFKVNHIGVEKEEDLIKLQGSKYLQSNINDTYKKAKMLLEKDRYVLFTGTSCQIEGLKSYLRKDFEKLYTQDIICHGVPSPKVWKKYLEYQKNQHKENIRDISLRNKDKGWTLFQTKILFDTKTYSKTLNKDLYMKAFLKNICLRDSCYNCSFKNKYRNSDITIADYWGVNNIHPNMDDNKGTSVIIVNSKKGEELFNIIKDKCVYEKSEIDYVYKYNCSYIKSATKNNKYDEFFKNLDNKKFDWLIKKYIKKESVIKKIIKKILNIFKGVIK